MKTNKTVEIDTCDFCDSKQEAYSKCHACGKAACFDCREKRLIQYNHAVFFQGSGDLYYCTDCEGKAFAKPDKVFTTYLAVRRLREECQRWNEDFKVRQQAADAAVKELGVR